MKNLGFDDIKNYFENVNLYNVTNRLVPNMPYRILSDTVYTMLDDLSFAISSANYERKSDEEKQKIQQDVLGLSSNFLEVVLLRGNTLFNSEKEFLRYFKELAYNGLCLYELKEGIKFEFLRIFELIINYINDEWTMHSIITNINYMEEKLIDTISRLPSKYEEYYSNEKYITENNFIKKEK